VAVLLGEYSREAAAQQPCAQLDSQSVSYSDSGVPGAAAVADGAGWVPGAQSPVEEKACATAAPVVAASPTTSTSAPAAGAWRANQSGQRRRLIEKVSAAEAFG
jgi:septal ring-binding cell division protein DamX